ncbi:MAG: DUF763 domain-containing protein [Arcticibacter sp.]
MKRSGTADLPLHYGKVPLWLSERMSTLGLAIVEAIAMEYGKAEVLRRLSDPFWFQSMGAVMGMDWHSSGITTSVMGALKRSVNSRSNELGLYICGGKGKASLQAPAELLKVAERTGLDGALLVRSSKLSAKVDNTAVQDGFQLYMHSFIVSSDGDWTVVQQGMREGSSTARRYHWHSAGLQSFVEDPHTAIYGRDYGPIINLADKHASGARTSIMSIAAEAPEKMIREVKRLVMPSHHDVRSKDVDIKRLGAMLWVAHEQAPRQFEDLLLLTGMGPRTLQSLALVSEVIYGTPSRFSDPARFSFAHGGKDGHPFPVPVRVYDDTIQVLRKAVDSAKVGHTEKADAIRRLSKMAEAAEQNFTPTRSLDALLEKEREDSWKYGGRTVFGDAKPPGDGQLKLF